MSHHYDLKEEKAEWLKTLGEIQKALIENMESLEVVFKRDYVAARYIVDSTESGISFDNLTLQVVKWKTDTNEILFLLITKQADSTSSDGENSARVHPLIPYTVAFTRAKPNGFVIYDVEKLDGTLIEFTLKQSAQFGDECKSFLKDCGIKVLDVDAENKNSSSGDNEDDDEACSKVISVFKTAGETALKGLVFNAVNDYVIQPIIARIKKEDCESSAGVAKPINISGNKVNITLFTFNFNSSKKDGGA